MNSIDRQIPPAREGDDIRLMNISQIARATGIDRRTIAAAMNLYTKSQGRLGLAYVQLVADEGRRLARRATVREWLESLEKRSIYAA